MIELMIPGGIIFIFMYLISQVSINRISNTKGMFKSLFIMLIGIVFLALVNDPYGGSFFIKVIGFFILLYGTCLGFHVLKKI